MLIDPWQFCAHNASITHVEGSGWALSSQGQVQKPCEVQLDISSNKASHEASTFEHPWQPSRLLAEVLDGSLKLGSLLIAGFIDAQNRAVLQLKGCYTAAWPCAHCGGPVAEMVQISRNLVLAQSEAQAQAWEDLGAQWEAGSLDADSDTDVVACLEAKVNVLDWFEDEMLLSMPMLVRHSVCKLISEDVACAAESPSGLVSLEEQRLGVETRKPFEHLASLLASGSGNNKPNKA